MANVVYMNKSISYVDFDSHYDQATNKFYLSIQFFVRDHLRIESDTVHPTETPRISIVNLMCVLELTSSNNNERREIIMKLPTDIDPL
jgi:hypothetical protein